MRQQLLAKQQELLKLQQQRLELELAEAKSRLENQEMELKAKEAIKVVRRFRNSQIISHDGYIMFLATIGSDFSSVYIISVTVYQMRRRNQGHHDVMSQVVAKLLTEN